MQECLTAAATPTVTAFFAPSLAPHQPFKNRTIPLAFRMARVCVCLVGFASLQSPWAYTPDIRAGDKCGADAPVTLSGFTEAEITIVEIVNIKTLFKCFLYMRSSRSCRLQRYRRSLQTADRSHRPACRILLRLPRSSAGQAHRYYQSSR